METFEPRILTGREARGMDRFLALANETARARNLYERRHGLVGGPYLGRRIPTYYPSDPAVYRLRGRLLHRDRRGQMGVGPGSGAPYAGASRPSGAGPTVPIGHSTPLLPFSKAKGADGGLIYEVVRATSAGAVTPTQQGEYLVGIWCEGGGAGGAGAWSFLYDGVHSAQYPVGGSGLDATGAIGLVVPAFYATNYGPIGQNIPSAPQTFSGGLAAVRYLFSNKPNPAAPPISDFTGVFVTGNESGTSGTAKTYSIPGPLGKPTAICAFTTIQAGTATGIGSSEIDFPAIGNYAAYTIPAVLARGQEPTYPGSGYAFQPVPDYDPAASFSLTHKAISLGAATDLQIAGVLRYIWR